MRGVGSYIVPGFGVRRFLGYHLYVVNADGSGLRRLTRNPIATHPLVWSPDGRTIYFGRYLVAPTGAERGGSRTYR